MFKAIVTSLLIVTANSSIADDTGTSPDIARAEVFLQGDTANLNEFVWKKRPLVVFADSPDDPRFIEQIEFLEQGLDDLRDRDVVVLTDTDRGQDTALRDKLHPRGFMLALIGKDGAILLRKPLPWDVREISRVIDKLPTRQQEIRNRRGDS